MASLTIDLSVYGPGTFTFADDGNGAHAALHFATLQDHPAPSANDFIAG